MTNVLSTLAQTSSGSGAAAGGMMILLVYLAIAVLVIAGFWKMFSKAGHPGWAAIVPIYNTYILCKVGGRPGWWLILFFIPVVSIIVWIILAIDVAKAFGKGVGFGLGVALLAIIFVPVLGFGSAQYQGPAAG